MRHYIEVRWKDKAGAPTRTLVNLTRIVSVVDDAGGCKIHMQGYCLNVADSYDDVVARIAAAEALQEPGRLRRPGGRPPVNYADICDGGVTLYEPPHERRGNSQGVPSGEVPVKADRHPGG